VEYLQPVPARNWAGKHRALEVTGCDGPYASLPSTLWAPDGRPNPHSTVRITRDEHQRSEKNRVLCFAGALPSLARTSAALSVRTNQITPNKLDAVKFIHG
jgi:hypothetical protein